MRWHASTGKKQAARPGPGSCCAVIKLSLIRKRRIRWRSLRQLSFEQGDFRDRRRNSNRTLLLRIPFVASVFAMRFRPTPATSARLAATRSLRARCICLVSSLSSYVIRSRCPTTHHVTGKDMTVSKKDVTAGDYCDMHMSLSSIQDMMWIVGKTSSREARLLSNIFPEYDKYSRCWTGLTSMRSCELEVD